MTSAQANRPATTQPSRTARHLAKHTNDKAGQERMLKALNGKREGKTTEANVKQAVNAAYDQKGKDSGTCFIDGKNRQVLHSSAGKAGAGGEGVTIFHYWDSDTQPGTTYLGVIAMGFHLDNSHYKIYQDYGQNQDPFRRGAKVNVQGDPTA